MCVCVCVWHVCVCGVCICVYVCRWHVCMYVCVWLQRAEVRPWGMAPLQHITSWRANVFLWQHRQGGVEMRGEDCQI